VTSETVSGPIVEVKGGTLQGTTTGDAHAFLGIPYAADPVGPLRFAPPASQPGWTGVLTADRPGPAAPQAPSRLATVMGTPRSVGVAEAGCLTLNVWAPADAAPGDRLPVLFWLHGGAFVTGSAGWDWYSGARLAATHGIVIVTANYRLGPLGYLYCSRLGPGNIGLLDQTAALEWAVDNIAAFGGDPHLITVGGQSAGGHASAMLAGAERTRGLVRRVVLQSAPLERPVRTAAEAAEVTGQFLEVLGLSDPQELREVQAEALVQATGRIVRRSRAGTVGLEVPLEPVRTDTVPWPDAATALACARDDLDVLIGYTADEGHAFLRGTPAVEAPETVVAAELDRISADGTSGAALAEHYRAARPGAEPWMLLGDAMTDHVFRVPALRVALDRAARGHPAHVYQFDWAAGIGSVHCIDLPFLFTTLDHWDDAPMLGPAAAPGRPELNELAAAFGGAVAAFVRSGAPQHSGLPRWPTYTPDRPAIAHFDTATTVREAPTVLPPGLA
jgi:para-nitrobenzyl esterase